jgi:hypothetical protein
MHPPKTWKTKDVTPRPIPAAETGSMASAYAKRFNALNCFNTFQDNFEYAYISVADSGCCLLYAQCQGLQQTPYWAVRLISLFAAPPPRKPAVRYPDAIGERKEHPHSTEFSLHTYARTSVLRGASMSNQYRNLQSATEA